MRALALNPSSITQYFPKSPMSFEEKIKNEGRIPLVSETSKENLKKKRPTNELSQSAKKRIKQKINWLHYLSENRQIKVGKKSVIRNFQLAFITLHLPSKQVHPHSEIVKKSLNNFLNLLRKNHNVTNYVWRAELQKNGNLHFHIFIDRYIHHSVIRKYWNSSIELLGYVSRYKEKFSKMSLESYITLRVSQGGQSLNKIKKAYYFGVKTQWKSPNTTDVHSLRNIENAAAYVIKYVTKEKPENPTGDYENSLKLLTGRLWFCSQSLSRLKNVTIQNSQEFQQLFQKLQEIPNTFILAEKYFTYIGLDWSGIPIEFSDLLHSKLWTYAYLSGYSPPFTRH